ncbi:4-(cytidine 5'-diphospho)-2-C-methyl-D-erythritol kinase [Roseivivax sp. GX 12232]|uniref:4-(cytidine 5'-diphospho)-2-C-methyl-D-erythritol kinase n=1 Tax=Roseivivax sp. GX 12232 TaxID=2900547 RepID=UPI001E5E7D4B|nr:4-(cytidine 5'-diphospho)-2-C-methyl-D-erythritol kinase [Roseivivax sp. GX 12232]MCE0504462.1 4-(cytidine 5'-diphospho)-2-C-methyl-D-erythritol kinase [Roseivivax sp. GX 12232]
MVEEQAPAKVNLSLHITGQRPDGYHLLDSLVVFADLGDVVRVEEADELTLEVTGPMSEGVPPGEENLVLRAARFLDPVRGARITLEKHLPSAAGIGGGSSDAAATLRALAELWGMPLPRQAMALGADVPMCLVPTAQRISGAGEGVRGVPGLPALPAVLVNPGVSVSTATIFAALESHENPPMAEIWPATPDPAAVAAFLSETRNDLSAPAEAEAPAIAEALSALGEDALFQRMSGSGATCFGLYADLRAAEAAAQQIAAVRPGWWVRAVTLNP